MISQVTITIQDWLNSGLSYKMYENDKSRGYLRTTARAAYGKPVEIVWDSIRDDRKKQIIEVIGDPSKKRFSTIDNKIEADPEAMAFFMNFQLSPGRYLAEDKRDQLYVNACVLNTVLSIYVERRQVRSARGGAMRGMWEAIAEQVSAIDQEKWPHTLPQSSKRLRELVTRYQKEKYNALIHRGIGNQNSRKVDGNLERLILSLYCMRDKPFVSYVHELYHQFLGGVIEIVDVETGEMFNKEDFYTNDGKAIEISNATVWHYINMPHNQRVVAMRRSGSLEYNANHRPHVHRTPPVYSFSKISMDDRDLPRLMPDGKRVKAYYAFDVASGCLIGVSYSRKKDNELFVDCMRNMFRFIHVNGFGMPMEVEVENHLVRNFADGMMKAGSLFPYVRWCNPGNSQEKRAEHMIRVKKLGEKKKQEGIGRPFARLEAYRTIQEKVFDENNDTYKTKTYSYDQLVEDDRRSITIYNNSLHPDQKKYKKLTRMQVLQRSLNPYLKAIDESLVIKYIGEQVNTTIRRNQYVTVKHQKYGLSTHEVVGRLEPNNYEVQAFFLPNEDGIVAEIHIWQGDQFIDTCKPLEKFQEAEAEKTEKDELIYSQQAKYIARYDADVKKKLKELAKVAWHEKSDCQDIEAEIVAQVSPVKDTEGVAAETDFMTDYNEEYYLARGLEDL